MKRRQAQEPADLTGRMVRDAHGQLYRVTMRGSCPDPWGRRDGDDANEPEPLATPVTPEGAR